MSLKRKLQGNFLTPSSIKKEHESQNDTKHVTEHHDRKIYEILPWRKGFDTLVGGTILPPSMNNQFALRFVSTYDVGSFQVEANGLILYLFEENFSNPEVKAGHALYIQMSNKDLLRINCQSDESGLSVNISSYGFGTADKQKLAYVKSPLSGHTPKTHSSESALLTSTYSNKTLNGIFHSNSSEVGSNEDSCSQLEMPSDIPIQCQTLTGKDMSTVQDKRIISAQKAWLRFQSLAKESFPEIIDFNWQPLVYVRKLEDEIHQMKMWQGFDYNNFGGDDAENVSGEHNSRRKDHRRKTSVCEKYQAAQTAQVSKVNEFSPTRAGHVEMALKEEPEVLYMGQALEMLDGELDEIKVLLNMEGIKSQIVKLLNQDKVSSDRVISSQSDHKYYPSCTCQVITEIGTIKVETLDNIPLSVSSNPKTVNVAKSSQNKDLHIVKSDVRKQTGHSCIEDDHFRGREDQPLSLESTSCFGRSKSLPVRKAKLCPFILPSKKKRSTKNHRIKKKNQPYLCTVNTVKRNDFTLRIWQNFNKESLRNMKTSKKNCRTGNNLERDPENLHPSLQTKTDKQQVQEFYYCQPCNRTLISRTGLQSHSMSIQHKNIVKAQMEGIILSLNLEGIPVRADEYANKLKMVEIIEEVLEDDVKNEQENGDKMGSREDMNGENTELCNEKKTIKKIKTYIHQTEALVDLKKLCEMRRGLDEKGKSYIPFTEFINSLEDSLCFEDNQGCFAPHGPEDDSPWLFISRADEPSHPYDELHSQNSSSSGKKEGEFSSHNNQGFSVSSNVKMTRSHRGITSNEGEWLEEEVTSPDLRFHEDIENDGVYFIKKNKKLGDKVILCKRKYISYRNFRHERNKVRSHTQRRPLSDSIQSDTAQNAGCYFRTLHSPYYPHAIISEPQELYPEDKDEGNTPKQIEPNGDIVIPHKLYEKKKYWKYSDLDKPSEFYEFDVDKNGDFVTTVKNTNSCSGNFGKVPNNEDFVSGGEIGDTFKRLLNSTLARQAHSTNLLSSDTLETHEAKHPVFTCKRLSDTKTDEDLGDLIWQPNSGLNTPVLPPDFEYLQEDVINSIGCTPEGFDKEFEELWNLENI